MTVKIAAASHPSIIVTTSFASVSECLRQVKYIQDLCYDSGLVHLIYVSSFSEGDLSSVSFTLVGNTQDALDAVASEIISRFS